MSFYSEILEQPEALRRFAREAVRGEEALRIRALGRARAGSRIFFTGMGSSLYAGYIASDALFKKGIPAHTMGVDLLIQSEDVLNDPDAILVIVSQSGSSPEVLNLLEKVRHRERVVAVSNYPASPLYQCGGNPLGIRAGTEYFTSSKSFSNTVAAMHLLALLLSGADDEQLEQLRGRFLAAADCMQRVIDDARAVEDIADFIGDLEAMICVGGGCSYTTASHLELVAEEACKVYGSRYTPEQFIHGPIELIRPRMGVVLLDFDPAYRLACKQVAHSMTEYGGKVLWITDRTDVACAERQKVARLAFSDPFLSPLVEIMPVELAVDKVVARRGGRAGELERVVKRMTL